MQQKQKNKTKLYEFCFFCVNIYIDADLAQLVEQRIRNAEVEGSSPLIGTTP